MNGETTRESFQQAAEILAPFDFFISSWPMYRLTWTAVVLWLAWSIGRRIAGRNSGDFALARHLLVLLSIWGWQSSRLIDSELGCFLVAGPVPTWRASVFDTWHHLLICLLMLIVVIATTGFGSFFHRDRPSVPTPLTWLVCLLIVATLLWDWFGILFFLTPFQF